MCSEYRQIRTTAFKERRYNNCLSSINSLQGKRWKDSSLELVAVCSSGSGLLSSSPSLPWVAGSYPSWELHMSIVASRPSRVWIKADCHTGCKAQVDGSRLCASCKGKLTKKKGRILGFGFYIAVCTTWLLQGNSFGLHFSRYHRWALNSNTAS